jgi:hypothetical protein
MHYGWLTGSLVEEEPFDHIYRNTLHILYTRSSAHGGAEGRHSPKPL